MIKQIGFFTCSFLCLTFVGSFNTVDDSDSTLATDESIIYDICYSPKGKVLLVADGKNIKWFSTENNSLLSSSAKGHIQQILSLDISRDSTLLVSGGRDSTVVVWNVKDNKVINRLKHHKGIVTSVQFSPDGRYIASGGTDNKVVIFDLKEQKVEHVFSDHNDDVTSVVFSPSQSILCSASGDGIINIYDFANNTKISALSEKTNWVRSISFSDDASKLISCGDNSEVIIWSMEDLTKIRTIGKSKPSSGWLLSAKFFGSGEAYASGSVKGVVKINTPVGGYVKKYGVAIQNIEVNPNSGKYFKLAIATRGKGVMVLDARNMKVTKK